MHAEMTMIHTPALFGFVVRISHSSRTARSLLSQASDETLGLVDPSFGLWRPHGAVGRRASDGV
jgi:hypothetical protein